MIRPATVADLDAIDEIERHSFTKPWPRATFEDELAREWAHVDVAVDDRGRVVAFCNYWLVVPEVNILAIATHPDARRRGTGARVLAHVLDVARAAGCTLAALEVRASNAPAIAMYANAGFAEIHRRAGYYHDDEDALVMTMAL